jgi:hypothetical protein
MTEDQTKDLLQRMIDAGREIAARLPEEVHQRLENDPVAGKLLSAIGIYAFDCAARNDDEAFTRAMTALFYAAMGFQQGNDLLSSLHQRS